MDQDIEHIYNLLVDENYPVTLTDLKNPTSEYMIKIVLTFLSGLSIDGSTIQRATFGQEQSLSYPEAHLEIISVINLHQVMLKISNRIFIKDLYLTDMTSPGAKKARRLIWTLLNFVLYANDKMKGLFEPLDAIFNRLNTLMELTQNKNEAMEARKEVILDKSKKAAIKEKLIKQIEETKKHSEQITKRIVMMEERVQKAKLAKQQELEQNGIFKQQVVKMNEKTVEMEETVVKSPEKYKIQLGNCGQDNHDKEEKVATLKSRLRDKQHLKSRFDKITAFVCQEYEKFQKVREVRQKFKTLGMTQAEVSKALIEAEGTVQSFLDECAKLDSKEYDAEEFDEVQVQYHNRLEPQRKTHAKLLSQVQNALQKLKEAEVRFQQTLYQKDDLGKKITSLNNEIVGFLKDCQALYNSDIQKQVEIEKLFREK